MILVDRIYRIYIYIYIYMQENMKTSLSDQTKRKKLSLIKSLTEKKTQDTK